MYQGTVNKDIPSKAFRAWEAYGPELAPAMGTEAYLEVYMALKDGRPPRVEWESVRPFVEDLPCSERDGISSAWQDRYASNMTA